MDGNPASSQGGDPRISAVTKRKRGRLMSFLFSLAAAYLTALVLLLIFEYRIIFIPSRGLDYTPKDARIPYEEVFLTTSDGVKIHGWWLPAGSRGKTVLHFHGNAGNIAGRLDWAVRLTRIGLNVFLLDYRGYGKSEGSPSEEGVYLDAVAAWEHLTTKRGVSPSDLIISGQSLGGGPAVELASKKPCAGLVIESTFCSTRSLARDIPAYALFLPFVPDRFRSLEKIGRLTVPVLVVHGDKDGLIPIDHGRRLFEAAREPKTFYVLKGADHNDWYQLDPDGYFSTWTRFVNRLPDASTGSH